MPTFLCQMRRPTIMGISPLYVITVVSKTTYKEQVTHSYKPLVICWWCWYTTYL